MNPTRALLLTNATVITGTGRTAINDAALAIDDAGKISYVGPARDLPQLPPSRQLDLGGRHLLPGFIDAHVHVSLRMTQGPHHALVVDPPYVAYETADRLSATLDAGITTARDLGGTTLGVKQALEDGLIRGPRLKIAVNAISHTGGHSDHHHHGGSTSTLIPNYGLLADNPDEARVAARKAIRAGADVIKICTTGGMGSEHDDPDDEGLREAEVRAIVEEGQRHGGRRVAAHAQGLAGIMAALRGGVHSIEHGYGIDDAGVDLALEQGSFIVPTLSTVFLALDKSTMQPYHYQKKSRWSGITKENISRAIDRGALIAMGTDAGVGPHGLNLKELTYLVELGMDPMAAIIAGTARAATLLDVADQTGTLEVGKTADFVVTATDPLADISALGDPDNIVMVGQDGHIRKDLLRLSPDPIAPAQ